MKELNRKVCIANNSNECIKTLCNFNIKSTSYATKGEKFCIFNTTVDIIESDWTSGNYRVIVKNESGDGTSQKWRFQSTSYMKDLFKVSK